MNSGFIQGENIILRAISAEDATAEYLSWINDPETTRGLVAGNFPSNLDALRKYIETVSQSPDAVMLAICEKYSGHHIGNVKIDRFDWISGTCELGILVGSPDYRGKGIGTEVCRLVTEYAFSRLNLRKVMLAVYANNPGAIRAYEKAGFQEEGRLKAHIFADGAFTDKIFMSIFRKH
jgi:RimJ/RimL family protein N-acetyltransferase